MAKVATAPARGPADRPRSRRPPLKVVTAEPSRRRLSRPVVIFIVVAIALLGALAGHIVLERTTLAASSLSSALSQAEVKHNELMLKRAELESPQRITEYAREHLGLVFPPSLNVVSGTAPHSDTSLPEEVPSSPSVPRAAGAQ